MGRVIDTDSHWTFAWEFEPSKGPLASFSEDLPRAQDLLAWFFAGDLIEALPEGARPDPAWLFGLPAGEEIPEHWRRLQHTGKATHLMQQRLSFCNALILEFNHNLQLLKNGPYPPALQQRVRSPQGHLANEDSAAFLKDILHDGLQAVILAHLSEVNNSPQLAMAAAVAALPEGIGLELAIARQDLATRLFSID